MRVIYAIAIGLKIANQGHSVVASFCAVEAGHRAVIYDRFQGVKEKVVGEGTHFMIPWVQRPIIFDCRTKPRNIATFTGTKGNCALC